MTVAEFLAWDPEDGTGALWQLRDGEPEMMAPTTDAHGSIQSELVYLITAHLRRQDDRCRVVTNPGVVPHVRSDRNAPVADIGVTCTPPSGTWMMPDPVLLIEVLSPCNEAETWANVWAYATIPSLAEILIVRSTEIGAEVLRRRPDGSWPEQPDAIGPDGELRADSIGFAVPLHEAYRTAGL